MDLGLTGKTAIVTGGASNIGRGICFTFAREGANVVIADRDEKQAKKTATEINALGAGRAIAIATDVTQTDSVEAMVKRALEDFKKIDVLVNDAAWTNDRLFVEKPRDEWEKEIDICYRGVIHCTRAVLDHMIQRKYGKIVSIASDAARVGEYREAVYAGCKAGVIAFSKSLAKEVGPHGINLNVVCPGVTPAKNEDSIGEMSMQQWYKGLFTPETQERMKKAYPLRRLGTAEDIANAVVFLSSDCASYVTGQTLSVSGGYTMA